MSTNISFPINNKDENINELDNFIKSAEIINKSDTNIFTSDEILTQDENGKETNFFYFIGRLNPPHNGHIKALKTLVDIANKDGSVPLILLGSGPGSVRTMDNPITFELKEAFLKEILVGDYVIQKMTNPAINISDYIEARIGEPLSNITKISILHIAGGKDEDTSKLSFALKSAETTAKRLLPNAFVKTGVKAIEAEPTENEVPMSATKVRKDTYKTILNGTGFNGWPQQYKDFYGKYAEQIYDEILYPLNNIPETEQKSVIINYIEKNKMPSSKRRIKGGTKKSNKKYSNRIYKRNNKKTNKKNKKRKLTKKK